MILGWYHYSSDAQLASAQLCSARVVDSWRNESRSGVPLSDTLITFCTEQGDLLSHVETHITLPYLILSRKQLQLVKMLNYKHCLAQNPSANFSNQNNSLHFVTRDVTMKHVPWLGRWTQSKTIHDTNSHWIKVWQQIGTFAVRYILFVFTSFTLLCKLLKISRI